MRVSSIAIYVIDAYSGATHSFQLGGCGEDLGGDFGLGANDQCIVFTDNGKELFRSQSDFEVGSDIGMGIEKFNTFFGNGVGNQNSAWHNEHCGSVRIL
jgi:hypothetical protein